MPLQPNSLPNLSNDSVVVIGCGSIGSRHIENLCRLGIAKIAAVDPVGERLKTVGERFEIELFSSAEEAILAFEPNVVFVCTPPVTHVGFALIAVRAGAHVFIEKPLSNTMECVDRLSSEAAAQNRVVQVGYNLRFHPGIRAIKKLADDLAVGRILWARAEVGQFLPDWRPSQDYRHSYTARRELGGGIILDASHEIDYMLWILGTPVELACMAGRVSRLEVDVEDCATLLVRFASGAQADVHMDFVQRGYSRSCILAGEEGKIVWDYCLNRVDVLRPGKPPETLTYEFQPNQMYVEEVKHFFECIHCNVAPSCGIAEASQSLGVALSAKAAASEKRWITVNA
jgi:predicted dehydrogenase